VYSVAVQELIDELGRLPGVGPKSAQRIAFHLLKLAPEDALRLARAITVVKERVSWCRRCFNIAEAAPAGGGAVEASPAGGRAVEAAPAGGGAADAGSARGAPTDERRPECVICADERRDPTVVCVVEEPRDVVAIEKTREYRGLYHVLQGAISHLDGIGADKLRVRELLARLQTEGIEEVIVATNPTIEGDATALYLARLLAGMPVKVTRLASGLPAGGDLEYADEVTLGRALEGRRSLAG